MPPRKKSIKEIEESAVLRGKVVAVALAVVALCFTAYTTWAIISK